MHPTRSTWQGDDCWVCAGQEEAVWDAGPARQHHTGAVLGAGSAAAGEGGGPIWVGCAGHVSCGWCSTAEVGCVVRGHGDVEKTAKLSHETVIVRRSRQTAYYCALHSGRCYSWTSFCNMDSHSCSASWCVEKPHIPLVCAGVRVALYCACTPMHICAHSHSILRTVCFHASVHQRSMPVYLASLSQAPPRGDEVSKGLLRDWAALC